VGPLYPKTLRWPANVDREIHLSPRHHPAFYAAQRFTLNITREAMKQAGYSPSVRLFEAGACGAPIISDWWEGLDSIFETGKEILVATSGEETLRMLWDCSDAKRLAIGEAARRRILAEHTPELRAAQLEGYLKEVHDNTSSHPARRNRRGRQADHGPGEGMAPQPEGKGTGGTARAKAGAHSDPSRVRQPAGAGH
jgi:spore maturation protein CgeB